MVTTHDLPTIAGVSSGADDDELIDLDRPAADEASARLKARLAALVADPAAVPADLAASLHDRLGRSPAQLVLATLQDLVGVRLRPHVPGTGSDERANWSQALPPPVRSAECRVGNEGFSTCSSRWSPTYSTKTPTLRKQQ